MTPEKIDKVRRFTVGFILGTLATVAIWDTFAAFHSESDTISDVLHNAGKKSQFVPFAFGALMGHLFFGVGSS